MRSVPVGGETTRTTPTRNPGEFLGTMSRLVDNPHAAYRFLPGGEPFSSGVVANAGHEIVNGRMSVELPWRDGLERVRTWLEDNGGTRHDLCGVELRCPRPLSIDEFGHFNQDYIALLNDWDMIVDEQNPIARTNVSPIVSPQQIMLHAVSYLIPSNRSGSFVVSGGGELPHRSLDRDRIVRVGETSPDAIKEKVQCVIRIMQTRLKRLEVDPKMISRVAAYSVHDWATCFDPEIISGLPAAGRVGINWFCARPPIVDLEFEMDIHGVYRHDVVSLAGR